MPDAFNPRHPLQEWEKPKEDLTAAMDRQENIIIENFGKDYENVADFEQKYNIKLPADITAIIAGNLTNGNFRLRTEPTGHLR